MAATQKTLASSTSNNNVKFLCSYGGKILPRRSDGLLRYVGGFTRIVSVPAYISFSDLMVKLGDLCGYSDVKLRCQLPNEDLDVLVSIKSDEDFSHISEEYRKASSISGKELKIRAILSPLNSPSPSPSPSPPYSLSSSSSSSVAGDLSPPATYWCKPPPAAVIRRVPVKKPQFNAVPYCYNYYPCHLQANSRLSLSSYFSQHPYYWR